MSAVPAHPRSAAERAHPSRTAAPTPRATWRPSLTVVANPTAPRSVTPFLLLCTAILAGAMLVVLLLNTQMAATAYQIRQEQLYLNELGEAEASLREDVERAGSPAELRERAEGLGMVPGEDVHFVRLSDGSVLTGNSGGGR
ncbi:hypothetical protein [Bogoriella caseilytica]|uniref:Cell division protein FtsB n=1 Tax=Bogoriella caseilytica TaxID=56055 RepID=A0A3N2B9A7_9MICO|nr:hypothetical protein [Bogoriella caseilytica]ROR71846.1 hypothetical protein EDD31_0184 [Bogoriella caseilytica]